MTHDEIRKRMSNGRRVSPRDLARHRAMRVTTGDSEWRIEVFGAARFADDPLSARQRLSQYTIRRDSALRFACATAQKNRVPFELITIELQKKISTTTGAKNVATGHGDTSTDECGEEVSERPAE